MKIYYTLHTLYNFLYTLQHMFFVTVDMMFGSQIVEETLIPSNTSIIRLKIKNFGTSGNNKCNKRQTILSRACSLQLARNRLLRFTSDDRLHPGKNWLFRIILYWLQSRCDCILCNGKRKTRIQC